METLGEFFAQLRERTCKRPFLTRADLKIRGLDWVKTEAKRRRYGSVADWRTAGLQEWIEHFMLVQETERPLTLREIARRADVNIRMIWKLAHGQRVGAETVKAAFIKGLGLPADGQDVRQALTLWAADRTTTEAGDDLQRLAGWRAGGPLEDDEAFLRRAIPLLLALTPDMRELVLESVANPRAMEALPKLVELAKLRDIVAKAAEARSNRKSSSDTRAARPKDLLIDDF